MRPSPIVLEQTQGKSRSPESSALAPILSRGWAKVTVDSGSGVIAYASVVDNITNDPTTVVMLR